MRPLEEILAYYLGLIERNSAVYREIENSQSIKYWVGSYGLLTPCQYLKFRAQYQKITESLEALNIPWHDSDGDEYWDKVDNLRATYKKIRI